MSDSPLLRRAVRKGGAELHVVVRAAINVWLTPNGSPLSQDEVQMVEAYLIEVISEHLISAALMPDQPPFSQDEVDLVQDISFPERSHYRRDGCPMPECRQSVREYTYGLVNCF